MTLDDPHIHVPVDPALPLSDPAILKLAGVIDRLGKQVETLNVRIGRGEQRMLALGVLVGIVILLAGVVTFLGVQVRNQAECQGAQNDAFRNYVVSSRAARDVQDTQQIAQLDQQVTLFNTVLNPNSTMAQRTAASVAYRTAVLNVRAATVAAKKARVDNPLPVGNCS